MLTKSLGLCLLAIAMPHPAAPQTGPDMQKIIERLDAEKESPTPPAPEAGGGGKKKDVIDAEFEETP